MEKAPGFGSTFRVHRANYGKVKKPGKSEQFFIAKYHLLELFHEEVSQKERHLILELVLFFHGHIGQP